jgi:hypothetical protein
MANAPPYPKGVHLYQNRPPLPTCVAKKDAGEKHRMKMRCFSYFKKMRQKQSKKVAI